MPSAVRGMSTEGDTLCSMAVISARFCFEATGVRAFFLAVGFRARCYWCATRTVVYVGEVEGAVTVKWAITCTALKVLLSAVRSTTTEPNMLIVPPIVIPDGSDGLVLGVEHPAAITVDVNAGMVTTPAPGVDDPLS